MRYTYTDEYVFPKEAVKKAVRERGYYRVVE